jgi:hypothetical protein
MCASGTCAPVMESRGLKEEDSDYSHYYGRKGEEKEKWKNVIDELIRLRISLAQPLTRSCTFCQKVCEKVIKCEDCGPYTFMCNVCEEQRHAQVLHKPQVWEVSARVLLLL